MSTKDVEKGQFHLAETIRNACLQTALEAYEDARIRGLCQEGAWECAVSALRGLKLEPLLAQLSREQTD